MHLLLPLKVLPFRSVPLASGGKRTSHAFPAGLSRDRALPFFRTMTAICFVCNLPILSHQVGLIWQGGNGWDDLMREQVEESTLKQRLGMHGHASTTCDQRFFLFSAHYGNSMVFSMRKCFKFIFMRIVTAGACGCGNIQVRS